MVAANYQLSIRTGVKRLTLRHDDAAWGNYDSFPLQHHRDGKSFSSDVALASYIVSLRSVDILCFNKELVQ